MASSMSGGTDHFRKAKELLAQGVRDKAYTAAVMLAACGEEVMFQAAAGDARHSSVFDIASLTKPLAAGLFFVLDQEGKIGPGDMLSAVLPSISTDRAAAGIRFVDLLAHTSGLPAWEPFYEEILRVEKKEKRRMWGSSEAHDRIVEEILRLPLQAEPGTACVYSDLGFMLLGRAMELVSFQPLEKLLLRQIAEPLEMRDTSYLPLDGYSECETGRLVSTGYSEIRRMEKVGIVDDENASAMGGAAGHAGVFSTAYDLFLFAREILRARRGEGRIFNRSSAVRMTTKVTEPPGCPRTPGWDTPTPFKGSVSQAGRHFPEGSFGHLGYTGCSIWIDPDREATVVLLTNRIFYGKQNDGLKSLRPLLHDTVMEELFP
ncbi:MAG: beta-lactamase family protein [Deltaproteobacteria bacterium]|nr:beta-lactamase family protein [Deltaproteobacteria bacterium]